jgi:hypothetical protein
LAGIAALIILALIAIWLARRTHRYLNPSLTGGVALLVVGLFVAATTIGNIGTTTAQVASGNYQQAVDLAQVRTAANDARANESLTLIQRGSGARYQQAWEANDKTVRETLQRVGDAGLTSDWDAYATAHEEIRARDDGGQWEQAVELATTQEANGATATFTAFDQQVTQRRDAASTKAIDQLGALGGGSTVWAVLIAIVSLLASWLIVRGIGQRIKEY